MDRVIKTHGLAVGRTLSLLLAIVCLSAPEFAQFVTDHDSSEIRDGSERTAAQIADALLEEVELFSGMVHAFDDRTLVVLKVL